MKKNALLDQALSGSIPDSEMPPALHASIMQAVRLAGPPEPRVGKQAIPRWLLVPAVALLVCVVLTWQFSSRPTTTGSALEHAGVALATSREMARTVPVTALAPLTQEWQRLNQDLDNTTQFLLAALP
jgi:hypothetical protein